MLAAVETSLFNRTFWVITEGSGSNLRIMRSGFGKISSVTNQLESPVKVKRVIGIEKAIAAYQAGKLDLRDEFQLSQSGSPFAKRVWRQISTVPAGKTISYGELAERIGSPAAVRAVGTACGRNQIPIFVPCHRIVRSDGSLGNYAYGSTLKSVLLRHERDMRQTLT